MASSGLKKMLDDPIHILCVKNTGKTFSSDLRKPCLKTGKSLSSPTKFDLVHEKITYYKMTQDQDDNPYKRVVLNNIYKEPEKFPEMKSWSIFSDMLDTYNMTKLQHQIWTLIL